MFTVEIDGEERIVAEEVGFAEYHRVTAFSSSTEIEFFDKPDMVTEDVADWVWGEYTVDVENYDIEVYDPDDPEVTEL